MSARMSSQPSIAILDARPASQTASPAILFRLRVQAAGRVHAALLRCQVQIDARGRRYDGGERQRLFELFGDASQFDRALRPITWAHASLVVQTFDGMIECELAVPCTYDLEVAAGKYLHAMREGDVPLQFLFSGTMFRVADGALRVEPVPWDVDAAFRLPAGLWRAAMDQHFPGGGWVRLERETIDRLQAFRGRAALLTWDEAIGRLLESAGAVEAIGVPAEQASAARA